MEDRYLTAAGLLLSAIPAGLFAIKFRSGGALHLIRGIDLGQVRDPAALNEVVGLLLMALAGLLVLAAGAIAVLPESVLPVVVGLLVAGSIAFSVALAISLQRYVRR
ncbi:MAG: hypothetical protein IPO95_05105 [Rhodanobacteraceae bacterium]|nr:hypothetical protein [Rhodanobacteraceae bacterium]MBL0042325.1 hypothetical protein [Xanthomonadales bacterium]MBP7625007.1 hypothetical protein [Xanthomonadales bacterium]